MCFHMDIVFLMSRPCRVSEVDDEKCSRMRAAGKYWPLIGRIKWVGFLAVEEISTSPGGWY
jgi:hypothetical protein